MFRAIATFVCWIAIFSQPWFLRVPSSPLWFQVLRGERATTASQRPSSLREAADGAHILIGTAVRAEQLKEAAYAATLAREYNMLEPEDAMKWEVVHPEPDRFDFSQADRIVAFAGEHNMKVRGHTLVWHRQNPTPRRRKSLNMA